MKRFLSVVLLLAMTVLCLAGCQSDAPSDTTKFKVGMITDVGGVNDESFNQSAWGGMEELRDKDGFDVSYIESERDSDYGANLSTMLDRNVDLIWGIGYLMKDAMGEAASANKDQMYALVDDMFADGELANMVSVMFKSEQSSFLAGYAAALKTETNHVGLVLGMESPTMARFTNGYYAGIAYGAKERGVEIRIDYQCAEAFGDPAIGKALAQKMYSDGADIVYAVAGFTGTGCIEAAVELGKWVIGVDLDQNYLAPNNLICSGLKNVGAAVYEISKRVAAGEKLGGTTLYMGLAEKCAGLATTGGLLGSEIEGKVSAVEAKIASGEIDVPYDEAGLTTYKNSL